MSQNLALHASPGFKNSVPRVCLPRALNPAVHPSNQLPHVFSEYFLNKVNVIRDDLDLQTVVSPIHGDPYTDAVFDAFQPVSEEHVGNVIFKSASKTYSLDPIQTSLFLECLDELLPAVTHMIYSSLVSGVFPPEFKTVIEKPHLIKTSLDHNNLKNYRPVLNLSFLSKILEKKNRSVSTLCLPLV